MYDFLMSTLVWFLAISHIR